jgi:acetyl-CoA/propionyl-CoA carboxylase biotin carboxyl carrier protein
VRWDSGVVEGDTIAGAFDSMIAKLIVTGASRPQALERARRALDELVVDGMPTVTPFHRVVVRDPAFAPDGDAPFTVHTRWIETEFVNTIEPFSGAVPGVPETPGEKQRVIVEVGGKRLEVVLPAGLALGGGGGRPAGKAKPTRRGGGGRGAGAAVGGDTLTAPMQGTVVKVAVADGDTVEAGDLVIVLEAMKMEQPLNAHKAGVISGLSVAAGETLQSGAKICEIKTAAEEDGE